MRTLGFALAGWLILAITSVQARAADETQPQAHRTPWTSGHVTGSPETPPAYEVERVFPNLKFVQPLDAALPPDSDRIFIAEQGGKVLSFLPAAGVEKADLAIDLKQTVTDWKSIPGCRGFDSLYGIAFHPNFAQNHYVYLCYALAFPKRPAEPIGTRVSRFTVAGDPPRFDPAS
jgi:glucose/arabinose dehydrogenase